MHNWDSVSGKNNVQNKLEDRFIRFLRLDKRSVVNGMHNWGSMNDWDAVIEVRTFVRERFRHSNDTLTF